MKIRRPRRHSVRAGVLPAAAAALLALGASGCLVDSRCRADHECSTGEVCNLGTGACYVECRADSDCTLGGLDVGRSCLGGKCQFRFDERVAAPDFCLKVHNPASTHAGSMRCLSQEKGNVVLLFFALLG